jgi:hypothetical protein
MSATGAGIVKLLVPHFYEGSLDYLYNLDAENKCQSNNMRVTGSALQGDTLEIYYDTMSAEFFTQTQRIECRGFRNPIEPRLWYGFRLSIEDENQNLIERTFSDDSEPEKWLFFDAEAYEPSIIPLNGFGAESYVDLANGIDGQVVSAKSEWTLFVNPKIPLQRDCWFEIFIPSDLTLELQPDPNVSFLATGIFHQSEIGNQIIEDIIERDQVEVTYKSADGSDNARNSLFFQGCKYEATDEPTGSLRIYSIGQSNHVKDTQDF